MTFQRVRSSTGAENSSVNAGGADCRSSRASEPERNRAAIPTTAAGSLMPAILSKILRNHHFLDIV
jgi:hypothetical protein